MSDEPCCSFCFNQDIPLFEGGFDSTTRICAFAQPEPSPRSLPSPVPEPAPPPERPSREARLASIPAPKTLVTHLDQFVIGQDIAKGCDRASAKDFHEIRAVFTRGVA